MENIEKCSGVNCPMQVGYDVANCQVKDCPFRTKPLNRYDLIRHLTIDQMAEFICGIYDDDTCKYDKFICGITIPNYDEGSVKQWLESEVE